VPSVRVGCLVFVAVGGALGCGDNIVPSTPSACTGDTVFSGVVRAFSTDLPFEAFPRLAGTEVCNADRPDLPCVTTDDQGQYELACFGTGDVLLSFSHPGFVRSMWLRVAIGVPEHLDATLLTVQQNADFYAPVGAVFPHPGFGTVAINDTTHLDGIAFSATGASGPFYSADGIRLDPAATGTIGDGVVFFIAPVGTLEIEIAPPNAAASCGEVYGGFLSTGHGFTVPVFEATEAGVYVKCR